MQIEQVADAETCDVVLFRLDQAETAFFQISDQLANLSRHPRQFSIFREQVFQIGLGEISGETLFAEDVGNGLGFALLEVEDFFFDGAGCDQFVGIDCACLTDSM